MQSRWMNFMVTFGYFERRTPDTAEICDVGKEISFAQIRY